MRNTFFDPILRKNPITVQVLGVCSALAVTAKLNSAFVMGISVTAVLALSNLIVSLLRGLIPARVRVIAEMLIISTLVTAAQLVLEAFFYSAAKELSIFVGLIVTNCVILGRLEGFALKNEPVISFVDGLGSGVGYALVLMLIGAGRELLGSGSLLGVQLIPEQLYRLGYSDNSLALLAPGAFFLLAVIVWIQRAVSGADGEA